MKEKASENETTGRPLRETLTHRGGGHTEHDKDGKLIKPAKSKQPNTEQEGKS